MWWVLALVLAGLAAAIPLLVRSRRRAAWAAELATASDEVAWFARVLLPQLQSASTVDQVAGGWAVAQARVTTAQDQLTELGATARREEDRVRAGELRDAVRVARDRVDRLVAARAPEPFTPELVAAASALEAALTPEPPPTRPG